jgi:hypothetical protein
MHRFDTAAGALEGSITTSNHTADVLKISEPRAPVVPSLARICLTCASWILHLDLAFKTHGGGGVSAPSKPPLGRSFWLFSLSSWPAKVGLPPGPGKYYLLPALIPPTMSCHHELECPPCTMFLSRSHHPRWLPSAHAVVGARLREVGSGTNPYNLAPPVPSSCLLPC